MKMLKWIFICIVSLNFTISFSYIENDVLRPERIDVDGFEYRKRTLIYSPINDKLPVLIERPVKYPLILSLHGWAVNPFIQNKIFDLKKKVREKKFFLAVPSAEKGPRGTRYWNASSLFRKCNK